MKDVWNEKFFWFTLTNGKDLEKGPYFYVIFSNEPAILSMSVTPKDTNFFDSTTTITSKEYSRVNRGFSSY